MSFMLHLIRSYDRFSFSLFMRFHRLAAFNAFDRRHVVIVVVASVGWRTLRAFATNQYAHDNILVVSVSSRQNRFLCMLRTDDNRRINIFKLMYASRDTVHSQHKKITTIASPRKFTYFLLLFSIEINQKIKLATRVSTKRKQLRSVTKDRKSPTVLASDGTHVLVCFASITHSCFHFNNCAHVFICARLKRKRKKKKQRNDWTTKKYMRKKRKQAEHAMRNPLADTAIFISTYSLRLSLFLFLSFILTRASSACCVSKKTHSKKTGTKRANMKWIVTFANNRSDERKKTNEEF